METINNENPRLRPLPKTTLYFLLYLSIETGPPPPLTYLFWNKDAKNRMNRRRQSVFISTHTHAARARTRAPNYPPNHHRPSFVPSCSRNRNSWHPFETSLEKCFGILWSGYGRMWGWTGARLIPTGGRSTVSARSPGSWTRTASSPSPTCRWGADADGRGEKAWIFSAPWAVFSGASELWIAAHK